MTLQEMLTQIMELVQAEVKCSYSSDSSVGNPEGKPWHPSSCRCHGTGKVPDPRYRGLAEVLSEPCSWWKNHPEFGIVGPHPLDCKKCGGTGRVLRPWENLPQGALALPLLRAALGARLLIPFPEHLAAKLLSIANPDHFVAGIVLEAMEATHATE